MHHILVLEVVQAEIQKVLRSGTKVKVKIFYRYLWYLIVICIAASFTYHPVPLPENPTYIAAEDVTIIFKEAARMLKELQALANAVDPERIRVLTVPFANKRLQMSHSIKTTTTDIIVFADDDAIWPPTLLPYVLACFEDQKVGTSQRVQPAGNRMTVWEVLAAFCLTLRNIETSSSTHIDGALPCLSGRTAAAAAYRAIILKDPEFIHGFTHDFWVGKHQLNSGDDKSLTRWMVSHGRSTCYPEAELLSTMKPNWRFLKQILRWTRNTWRSELRSLFMERYIWTTHPYVAYTMVDKLFKPFTLLIGPSTIPVTDGGYHLPWWSVLFATRTAKLLPHLRHQPQDVTHVPAYILFGYHFAIMKLHALCTLHAATAAAAEVDSARLQDKTAASDWAL
ncbi:glycosyltransferase family 2 protein [Mycena galericulata]|nr:glycosyltransferase family 2 protein [Mycena galericulata]